MSEETLAQRRRTRTFQTADGYRLRYVDGKWTDGDLEFDDDRETGWPHAANGDLLQGDFIDG